LFFCGESLILKPGGQAFEISARWHQMIIRLFRILCIFVTVTLSVSARSQDAGLQDSNYKLMDSGNSGNGADTASEELVTSFSEVRKSNRGYFLLSIKTDQESVVMNKFYSWTIHVENSAGSAVDKAVIKVSGGMPAHDHPMPAVAEITHNLGNGDYQVEGINFHMPGLWRMFFYISADDVSDTVIFDLVVE